MDAGLLGVRLIIGLVLVVHATQKWRGWFNGPGFESSVIVFVLLGQLPARAIVQVAVTMELIAAALLLAGFATPLALVSMTIGMTGPGLVSAARSMHGGSGCSDGGDDAQLGAVIAAATMGVAGAAVYRNLAAAAASAASSATTPTQEDT